MGKNSIIALLGLAVIILAVIVFCPTHKEQAKMNSFSTTDPEFATLWDNFLTQDVLPHGQLEPQTRWKILLAAHIATQSVAEYKLFLGQALDGGLTTTEAKEILYQAVPYVGMAKAYDFFAASNEVLQQRGIKLPLAGQATTTPQDRFAKGLAVQKSIFGSQIDQMRENAPQNQKHIQDYLSANCFGDYYTRGGLDLKTRELLTFALLISMGGADAQVKGHIRGNLNVGNNKEVLLDAITQLLPYIGYPRSLNALSALNEVVPEN